MWIKVSRQMRGMVGTLELYTYRRRSFVSAWILFGLIVIGSLLLGNANGQVHESSPMTAAKSSTIEPSAVLAGGCFWGVDAVFKHVQGVTSVTSGYAGGSRDTAQYETVSTGTTGHAESVKISYDPSRISYMELLKIF